MKYLPFVVLLWICMPAKSQIWGEDSIKAQEMNARYTDAIRLEKYEDAVVPLEWLYENAPQLSQGIYIHGEKIFKSLEEKTKDQETKTQLQEKLMSCYDQRIKYFGREGFVLNRKAFSAYLFWKNDADRYAYLFEMFEKLYKQYPDETSVSNHVAFMDLLRRMKYKDQEVEEAKLLNIYDQIQDQIAKQPSKEVGQTVDDLFIEVMGESLDCDFIEQRLGPKLSSPQPSINQAKLVIKLSLDKECTDLEAFAKALEILDKLDPNPGIKKFRAIKAVKSGDYQLAENLYQQAIELSDEAESKSELYELLARLYILQNNQPKSREAAREAIKMDGSRKSAYKLIGDLYYNSFETCKERKSQVEDRLIFLIAYDMYEKAGDHNAMSNAEKQFPSTEDIFNDGKNKGDQIKVECWINETTTLRPRPQNQ